MRRECWETTIIAERSWGEKSSLKGPTLSECSSYYEVFEQFTTAIDGCLDGLPTVYKGEMETLLTHKFQMFGEVPLLAA